MSDIPDYDHGQPQPVPNDGASMHELVATELLRRRDYGLRKYGTLLQAFNKRDPGIDAFEEALDLVVYVRQWLEEWSVLLARLNRIYAAHTACEDCGRCSECGVAKPCPTAMFIREFHATTRGEVHTVSFICDKCKNDTHSECAGGTWCDCQHKTQDT